MNTETRINYITKKIQRMKENEKKQRERKQKP